MKIELTVNSIDETALGLIMYYGEDEYGEFHCLELGFLIFSLLFYKY